MVRRFFHWGLLAGRQRHQMRRKGSAIVPAVKAATPILPNQAFTPTQPRTARTGFTGRQSEVEAILQGLLDDKAHVVIYSERGRGKTSLANIVVERLRRRGMMVVRCHCEASSTFDSFMRGLLRNLPSALLTAPVRQETLEGCEAALPSASIRPDEIVTLLPKLRLKSLICVIDELDRVTDQETRTMLADTIKQLSDRAIPIQFILIGVSENLEQLLGQHPSIQRALLAIPLALLSDEDIAEIVTTGASEAALGVSPEITGSIVGIARGMPYLAHLLGLRTAQVAARRDSRVLARSDFLAAVERLVSETPAHVIRQFDEITSSGNNKASLAALETIARAPQDRWGNIRAAEVAGEDVLIGDRRIALPIWGKILDAGVVLPARGNGGQLAFAHRALIQYVLLRQTREFHSKGASAGASASGQSRPVVDLHQGKMRSNPLLATK
jgi:hypothetical protein